MSDFESNSPEETLDIAAKLATEYNNHLVLLFGPMGAGKTLFTKGFATGMGISQNVSSPTYTIMNEYRTLQKCLYHLDLYRLHSLEEVIDTGLYEVLESGYACLVEWPERVADLQKLPHLAVTLSTDPDKSPDYRKITWHWNGAKKA